MARAQTLADLARALPFASYSKRDGFDWWRPDVTGGYAVQFERGQEYALALLEAEGPRGGSVSALGSILLTMVAQGDAQAQRGVILGFASVLADMNAAAMVAEANPTKLRSLYAQRRRDTAALVAADAAGENVAPFVRGG